ncbi:site-specific DNA-methyltransferase [Geomonas ferrireducens]|uniref:site-specific DNA-methyltransferase n=1 Tax=Geomonas ferrireducens TaxID=2570227 RepID=UPI0010A752C7|nr:site-specific DNA-methyltransferase [Geomonas ferrireducens]
MTEQVEKLDLSSSDIAKEKRQELLRLFPEIRTEGGKLNIDLLKLTLGEAVDVGKERYGMNWPGKAECFKTIQTGSMGTLRSCREESVNFDSSENVVIEGDNLEALKLLQKSYLGKVKMIYIDPPYNTGNDFIYPDNFSESLQTYLEYTGQVDSEGRKFGTNTDADGRFHSKWLNMMYPRLYLARNLLQENGVIFISIDDNEVENLRKLCNEIFGEENFIACAAWQKAYTSNMTAQFISNTHDYIVIYGRNTGETAMGRFARTEEQKAKFKNFDSDARGPWKAENLSAGKFYSAGQFEIVGPTGEKFLPPPGRFWRCNQEQYQKWLADGRITFGKDGTGRPMLKKFLSEVEDGLTPNTWWKHEDFGSNKEASLELKQLFGGDAYFQTPKPTKLLKKICELVEDRDAVILDFFAGSGTTGHAVLDLNKQDGGNRKFILVQLPEPTEREDYPTIAEITKERLRRVIKKLNDEDAGKLDLAGATKQDRGFRVFKLSESNFTTWNTSMPHDAGVLEQQLQLHIEHIRKGRTADDILYEILLKSGFTLTTSVEEISLAGKTVHAIAGGALFICLERQLTLELIRAMAEARPERIVCLDEGFAGNDQLKANAVQIFKTKGVTSFKTV